MTLNNDKVTLSNQLYSINDKRWHNYKSTRYFHTQTQLIQLKDIIIIIIIIIIIPLKCV